MTPTESRYYQIRDTHYNYCALAVYNRYQVNTETALSRMGVLETQGKRGVPYSWTDEQKASMTAMRDEGYSYNSIAAEYGMRLPTVFAIIKRWREKNGTATANETKRG